MREGSRTGGVIQSASRSHLPGSFAAESGGTHATDNTVFTVADSPVGGTARRAGKGVSNGRMANGLRKT